MAPPFDRALKKDVDGRDKPGHDGKTKKRPGLSTQPLKTLIRYRSAAKASARLRGLLLEHRLADLLLDRALEVQRLGRQVFGFRLQEIGVEAAIVVDAFQR